MISKEYIEPKILFLKGVYIKDCIPVDDIFEQRIIEQLASDNPVIYYKELPSFFTGLSKWINKTNLKCWYCDLNFDNPPVFIPRVIEKGGADDYSISVHGCFCTFCCAASHIDLYYQKICNNIEAMEMLKFLYKLFTGKAVKEILRAPSKFLRTSYGGEWDDCKYRAQLNQITSDMKALECG
jgi:hypothetical protein